MARSRFEQFVWKNEIEKGNRKKRNRKMPELQKWRVTKVTKVTFSLCIICTVSFQILASLYPTVAITAWFMCLFSFFSRNLYYAACSLWQALTLTVFMKCVCHRACRNIHAVCLRWNHSTDKEKECYNENFHAANLRNFPQTHKRRC